MSPLESSIDFPSLEASAEHVSYNVPGSNNNSHDGNRGRGRLMIYGKKSAPVVLIFCAGFPDSVHAFLPLASKLAKENDCLCGGLYSRI